MVVTAVAAPRPVRRPREIDWRLIAGGVTALIGVVGVLVVVMTLVPEERTVVVAAHELAPGTTIGPTDLSAARVRLPEGLAAQTVPEPELSALVGRQVREPIHAQEMVTRTRLSAPHAALGVGQVQVRLPLKPDAAVPDDLQPGDPVTILGTIP
jgi:Flp pilus assembly protein CpaB